MLWIHSGALVCAKLDSSTSINLVILVLGCKIRHY